MTTNEDLDKFINSLSAELGSDTLMLLSAENENRPFLGAEALATYALYLFGIFASVFLESLKKELESGAKAAGRKFAELIINKVKSALTKLKKPEQISERDQRQALSTINDALHEAVTNPEVATALKEAERAGLVELVGELKAKGMEASEAQKKAEQLMRMIMSRLKAA